MIQYTSLGWFNKMHNYWMNPEGSVATLIVIIAAWESWCNSFFSYPNHPAPFFWLPGNNSTKMLWYSSRSLYKGPLFGSYSSSCVFAVNSSSFSLATDQVTTGELGTGASIKISTHFDCTSNGTTADFQVINFHVSQCYLCKLSLVLMVPLFHVSNFLYPKQDSELDCGFLGSKKWSIITSSCYNPPLLKNLYSSEMK